MVNLRVELLTPLHSKQFYFGGDRVPAVVILETDAPLTTRSLHVELVGSQTTKVQETEVEIGIHHGHVGVHAKRKRYQSTRRIFAVGKILLGTNWSQRERGAVKQINAGIHRFPVEFVLPSSLPPSVVINRLDCDGVVEYSIKVYLDNTALLSFNKTAVVSVPVGGYDQPLSNLRILMSPKSAYGFRTAKTFLMSPGEVSLTGRLLQKAFFKGDKTKIRVLINNKSTKTVSAIRFMLRRYYTVIAEGKTESGSDDQKCCEETVSIAPNCQFDQFFDVTLPCPLESSTDDPLLKIRFSIVVEAVVSSLLAANLALLLPIALLRRRVGGKDFPEPGQSATAIQQPAPISSPARVVSAATRPTVAPSNTAAAPAIKPVTGSSTNPPASPEFKQLVLDSGGKYEGMTVNGKPHGNGTLISMDNFHYQGEFLDGSKHGHGVLTYPNGDVFDGIWSKNTIVDGIYNFVDPSAQFEGSEEDFEVSIALGRRGAALLEEPVDQTALSSLFSTEMINQMVDFDAATQLFHTTLDLSSRVVDKAVADSTMQHVLEIGCLFADLQSHTQCVELLKLHRDDMIRMFGSIAGECEASNSIDPALPLLEAIRDHPGIRFALSYDMSTLLQRHVELMHNILLASHDGLSKFLATDLHCACAWLNFVTWIQGKSGFMSQAIEAANVAINACHENLSQPFAQAEECFALLASLMVRLEDLNVDEIVHTWKYIKDQAVLANHPLLNWYVEYVAAVFKLNQYRLNRKRVEGVADKQTSSPAYEATEQARAAASAVRAFLQKMSTDSPLIQALETAFVQVNHSCGLATANEFSTALDELFLTGMKFGCFEIVFSGALVKAADNCASQTQRRNLMLLISQLSRRFGKAVYEGKANRLMTFILDPAHHEAAFSEVGEVDDDNLHQNVPVRSQGLLLLAVLDRMERFYDFSAHPNDRRRLATAYHRGKIHSILATCAAEENDNAGSLLHSRCALVSMTQCVNAALAANVPLLNSQLCVVVASLMVCVKLQPKHPQVLRLLVDSLTLVQRGYTHAHQGFESQVLGNIASLHKSLGENSQAYFWYRKALLVAEEQMLQHNKPWVAVFDDNNIVISLAVKNEDSEAKTEDLEPSAPVDDVVSVDEEDNEGLPSAPEPEKSDDEDLVPAQEKQIGGSVLLARTIPSFAESFSKPAAETFVHKLSATTLAYLVFRSLWNRFEIACLLQSLAKDPAITKEELKKWSFIIDAAYLNGAYAGFQALHVNVDSQPLPHRLFNITDTLRGCQLPSGRIGIEVRRNWNFLGVLLFNYVLFLVKAEALVVRVDKLTVFKSLEEVVNYTVSISNALGDDAKAQMRAKYNLTVTKVVQSLTSSATAAQPSTMISSAPAHIAWMPDTATDQCLICSVAFTFFTRKHHCRSCGKIFCSTCAPSRIFAPLGTTPQRVCDVCVKK